MAIWEWVFLIYLYLFPFALTIRRKMHRTERCSKTIICAFGAFSSCISLLSFFMFVAVVVFFLLQANETGDEQKMYAKKSITLMSCNYLFPRTLCCALREGEREGEGGGFGQWQGFLFNGRWDRNEKFNWEFKLFLTFASFNAGFSRNYTIFFCTERKSTCAEKYYRIKLWIWPGGVNWKNPMQIENNIKMIRFTFDDIIFGIYYQSKDNICMASHWLN